MGYEAIVVLLGLTAMLVILFLDKMRPGFTLFSGAIIFMATGVISPRELTDGFASKEMITIAILFLVGEGVRQSGALNYAIRRMLPRKRASVGSLLLRVLPFISTISMMLNNTAVVVIFVPEIKRWAARMGISVTKFLIPLSYATILGGLCTLVGTSTNMVVNGMMIDAGYRGFNMFELGKVGGVIAVVGIIYLVLFSKMLLPDTRSEDSDDDANSVDVILAARFPGVGRRVGDFDFERHYGVKVKAIFRRGLVVDQPMEEHILAEGDTLRLLADDVFTRTWRDSSAFYIISSNRDNEDEANTPKSGKQRWLGLILLVFMIGGVALGEKFMGSSGSGRGFDIFPFAAVVMVVMAVTKLFPAKRYTKYISWDVLIAIASAFAISRAMSNSGINNMIATWIIGTKDVVGPYGALALVYLIAMLLTEFITNSAAVAIAFPVALAVGEQLGVDPMPFFVAICIAASASFSSPIGYQTNLIVQGVGGYKFKDYIRIGIWLNIITFVISITLIPRIWSF